MPSPVHCTSATVCNRCMTDMFEFEDTTGNIHCDIYETLQGHQQSMSSADASNVEEWLNALKSKSLKKEEYPKANHVEERPTSSLREDAYYSSVLEMITYVLPCTGLDRHGLLCRV